ncbi:AAEL001109-PA [Aedes aegypti]|uniref:Glutaredoxin-related protein 5, mitochondrial n=2 Tax=Aedes aegypti TaxID=7159 RepID=A0A1S4EXU0_AEDAE|nr:glutaredoxin-related protein 5, mitochondrial [Aedes aegypti]EAT47763.1 AAEL001109-PA [Aedes aegypti]
MSLLVRKLGSSAFGSRTSFFLARTLCANAVDAKEIDKLVHNNKVVVFMKGNPEQPRCGFSNAVVQILRMHAVNYDSHDVLQSDALRQAIKDYSNWPTIPQVFINGEFVGGCDIMLQMHQNGELIDELKKVGITSALVDAAGAEEKK